MNVQKEFERILSDEIAKEIDKKIIDDLMDPFSNFNDPDGSKKKRHENQKLRKKKLGKILKEDKNEFFTTI